MLQPGAAPRSARLRFARKSPGSGSHVLGQVGLSPCVLALPVLWIVEKFGDVAPGAERTPKRAAGVALLPFGCWARLFLVVLAMPRLNL